MSVYSRYKRDPDGLRKLVELLEVTPLWQRNKMIRVGQEEDPDYTARALSLMFTFEDIERLSDAQLAELLSLAPPRLTGCAVSKSPQELQQRFLKNALPNVFGQLKESMMTDVPLKHVGAAQLKVVMAMRQLEKRGMIKLKKIPYGLFES